MDASNGRTGWIARIGRIVLGAVLALLALLAIGWASLALALDGPGRILAGVYALLSLLLLALARPRRVGRLACAGLFGLVLAWWLSIEPSNDRHWLPEVSQLPLARVEGERLTVTNVRNFEYRTREDFTPRWEERTYDLARVRGMTTVPPTTPCEGPADSGRDQGIRA